MARNDINNDEFLQDQVKEYIARKGLRKNFFAQQIGISPSALSNWFSGKASLRYSKLLQIENIIND